MSHVDPLELGVELGTPLAERDLPTCAIVILNLNGRQHLAPCFETLAGLDYPRERFEVILIDNASTDGSVEEMRRDHDWVQLIVNEENVGFSAGCNQGAEAARRSFGGDGAQVLVFLNNDMRVQADWLRELVSPVAREECKAATAKMFSWDGKLMNSAGGGMNFHGIGIQRGYLDVPSEDYDWPRKTLFACGGAMAIESGLFADLGGFDEEFFAYYEDVDLGWRIWLAGHEVWYVPSAVCYHHHSSTSKKLPNEMIRLLQVRNPLLACFKNYDDESLRRVLPAMLALSVRRMYLASGLKDDTPFRIEHAGTRHRGPVRRAWDKARAGLAGDVPVRRVAAADMIGINDLLGAWDHWVGRRAQVQENRRRTDAELFRLFLRPKWCIEDEPGYRELQDGLVSFLGIDRLFDGLTEPGPDPQK